MKKFLFKSTLNVRLLQKLELVLLVNKLFKFNRLVEFVIPVVRKHKNVCFISGGTRSINTYFFLSRMSIKKTMSFGLINGLRKIS